jgi:hypothetical protein
MSRVVLEVPDEALDALRLSPDEFGEDLRMAAAVKLYELGRPPRVPRPARPECPASSSSHASPTTAWTRSA